MLQRLAILFDRFAGFGVRIVIGAHVKRRAGRNQDRMRDPATLVAGEIANHFSSTQGVADEDYILEIERVQDGGDVVGERVKVVAAGRIVGTRMAAAVEGDAAPASTLVEADDGDVPPVGAEPPRAVLTTTQEAQ